MLNDDLHGRAMTFRESLQEMETERLRMAAAFAVAAERFGLSLREVEILANVADGRTNEEIGAALFIATETVKSHICKILPKMAARNRAHAVALAAGVTSTGYLNRTIVETAAAA